MATDFMFQMTVVDVFMIKGRGMVVTGCVERGMINVGDAVQLSGAAGVRKAVVKDIEAFRKRLTSATAGENIGLFLDGIGKDDVHSGDVLVASNNP